ncbi:hypothetical protein V7T18_10120 [Segatella copri]|uniref:hypothetical protein n=1 Tax=Segatella copri TaxID=165179 RepID=UPI002FF43351
MKKFRFFSFASAMLLASAAGMVSCSSDSIEPTSGPGATGQVVKTQFAINIPYGGNSSTNQAKKVTRMTDEMTQQSGKPFRGISDIVLLTFNGNPSTDGNTEATSIIDIGTDGNAYAQDKHSKLYRDIEIPVGTNHMLFYGRATKKSDATDFQAGKITDKGDKKTEKTLANIAHELTPINSRANFTTDTDAGKIIDALNSIANAKVQDEEYTWATTETETTRPAWLTENEKKFLAARYKEFISLKAGSRTSVVAFIKNLQTALVGETGEPTIHAERKLTKEIYDKCVAALTAIESIDFPGKFKLPDGVATLSWATGGFAYNTPGNVTIGNGNSINYQKICYPAELSYFVNTTTMVSDKDMSNLSEFPTYENWTKPTGANWEGKDFTNTAVAKTTRTVGLKDPVQYSVAVLKSTVRCKEATLEDNAKDAGGFKANQSITVNDNSFPVTGILIGGQPASVDWKYEPASSETFENTIYDNVMNGSPMYAKYASEVPTVGNYTLVFDNKKTGAENSVYVTIELTNKSGQAFYGKDGISQKDTKFYLVGILNPNKEGLPKPAGVNRVFVQDYVTTANFKIKDLKSAYNCIPDLRTSGINVGLAVDLSWKEGITFDVEI